MSIMWRLIFSLSFFILTGCMDHDPSMCGDVEETCNGVDDDCDGTVDLDPSGGRLRRDCSNACGDGFEECHNGIWDDCTAPQPTVERCNGVDDDCDGEIDDGCDCVHGASRRCISGEHGGCEDGMQVCDGGTWSECRASDDFVVEPESCDRRDNDCDGSVDEGLECPWLVVVHDGHRYVVHPEAVSWTDALETCQALGSGLASIESSEENIFIAHEAWSFVLERSWIGLNDRVVEGEFRWSGTDTVPLFTSWYQGQPDDAYDGEDCVEINYGAYGGWNDDDCSAELPFICEEQ